MTGRVSRVCLIGSSKFKDEFRREGERLEKAGVLVLMMSFFAHADGVPVSTKEREVLERVDRARIDLADAVYVVNVGGYVGESTAKEIEYAHSIGKSVTYLSPRS